MTYVRDEWLLVLHAALYRIHHWLVQREATLSQDFRSTRHWYRMYELGKLIITTALTGSIQWMWSLLSPLHIMYMNRGKPSLHIRPTYDVMLQSQTYLLKSSLHNPPFRQEPGKQNPDVSEQSEHVSHFSERIATVELIARTRISVWNEALKRRMSV